MVNEKDEFASTEYIEKRLSEMLREDMAKVPEAHISLEELYALAEEDKIRRRKRFIKYASAAAMFILICSVVLFVAWPGGAVPADADKSSKTQVDKDGNAVIINEENMEGEKGSSNITLDDWDAIKKVEGKVNNLCIPEYYPKDFEFVTLELKIKKENLYTAIYFFSGANNSILQIQQNQYNSSGGGTTFIEDGSKTIETSKGAAMIYKDKATIKVESSLFTIITMNCDLSDKQYKDIIEGIKIIE